MDLRFADGWWQLEALGWDLAIATRQSVASTGVYDYEKQDEPRPDIGDDDPWAQRQQHRPAPARASPGRLRRHREQPVRRRHERIDRHGPTEHLINRRRRDQLQSERISFAKLS